MERTKKKMEVEEEEDKTLWIYSPEQISGNVLCICNHRYQHSILDGSDSGPVPINQH